MHEYQALKHYSVRALIQQILQISCWRTAEVACSVHQRWPWVQFS